MNKIFLSILLAIIISYMVINTLDNYENYENNGINSFDGYFYINLKDRKDRKKQITNELKRVGIPQHKIIRIDAVKNKYNGHIGCCKSHIKSIEIAKQMNLETVVIFEDDFIFTVKKEILDEKINHFIKKYPNFDIVQLTTVHCNLENINDPHIKKVRSATTASCYIIKRKFYNKLLNDLTSAKIKMENEMTEFNKENNGILKKKYETPFALDQHWFKLQRESNWYMFFPYLGTQGGDAGKSSIMNKLESFIENFI